jgi:hypothetical protein
MARLTQAAILADSAAWRLNRNGDASALTAAEIITRDPIIPAPTADLDLPALAFAGFPGDHAG